MCQNECSGGQEVPQDVHVERWGGGSSQRITGATLRYQAQGRGCALATGRQPAVPTAVWKDLALCHGVCVSFSPQLQAQELDLMQLSVPQNLSYLQGNKSTFSDLSGKSAKSS